MASRKGVASKIHTYYKIESDKAVRLKKSCSRCGKGVFMSEHKGRHTCGKCGLTEFNQ